MKKNYFKIFFYQTFTELKLYFRIPMSVFWIFLFPLLQLFLFGSIFGGQNPIQITVGFSIKSDSELANDFVNNLSKNSKIGRAHV